MIWPIPMASFNHWQLVVFYSPRNHFFPPGVADAFHPACFSILCGNNFGTFRVLLFSYPCSQIPRWIIGQKLREGIPFSLRPFALTSSRVQLAPHSETSPCTFSPNLEPPETSFPPGPQFPPPKVDLKFDIQYPLFLFTVFIHCPMVRSGLERFYLLIVPPPPFH